MDSSIRLYNTNGRLILDAEGPLNRVPTGRPTTPLGEEKDCLAEAPIVEEASTEEALSQKSVTGARVLIDAPQEGAINRAPTGSREQTQRALSQGDSVDVADFEAIFLRFQGPITNFIYHLIGNREQAYDLTQDVFVKAYKALLGGTVVQPGALSAWLYRIAANTTTDTLRRRRLIAWLPLSLFNEDRGIGAGVLSDSGGVASESFTANNEDGSNDGRYRTERGGYDGSRFENRVADRELVERVLKQLPHKYAICLWLYENDGLSCAEIANVLNISASAVKMRLMRARERFITLYKQEVGDE